MILPDHLVEACGAHPDGERGRRSPAGNALTAARLGRHVELTISHGTGFPPSLAQWPSAGVVYLAEQDEDAVDERPDRTDAAGQQAHGELGDGNAVVAEVEPPD